MVDIHPSLLTVVNCLELEKRKNFNSFAKVPFAVKEDEFPFSETVSISYPVVDFNSGTIRLWENGFYAKIVRE